MWLSIHRDIGYFEMKTNLHSPNHHIFLVDFNLQANTSTDPLLLSMGKAAGFNFSNAQGSSVVYPKIFTALHAGGEFHISTKQFM